MKIFKKSWIAIFLLIAFSYTASAQYFAESFENEGALPTGWTITQESTINTWFINQGNGGQGPGNVKDGEYCVHFKDFAMASGIYARLESPVIDLSGSTNPQFSFWYYHGGGNNFVDVLISTDGTNFTNIHTTAAGTSNWSEVIIDLSSYSSETNITIAFDTENTFRGYYDVHIDKISIAEPPSCPRPLELSASVIADTHAILSWTDDNATEWNVEMVEYETVPTGTPTETNVTNSYLYEGLEASTTYDYYVQADCAVDDQSEWSGPYTFTTDCTPVSIPYFEEFTENTIDCWAEIKGLLAEPTNEEANLSLWAADDFGNQGNSNAQRINIAYDNKRDWLITKTIDLGTASAQLEFDLALTAHDAADIAEQTGSDDKFVVIISTDFGTNWNTSNSIRTWDNTGSTDIFNNISTNGERIIIDLSAYSGQIKIGFYAESTVANANNDLFIDNLAVRIPPTCMDPSHLSISNITDSQAILSWDAGDVETAWDIAYGIAPYTLEGTPTIEDVTNPYTLESLMPATTYEYYVRADCGSGDESIWKGPLQFTTNCVAIAAPYSQNFDGAETPELPACWTSLVISTASSAAVRTSDNKSVSPDNSVQLWNANAAEGDNNILLVSPEFSDLTSQANKITFNAYLQASGLIVGTMTDPSDVSTFVSFETIPANEETENTWVNYEVIFDELYTGEGTFIVFKHAAEESFENIYIDDFEYLVNIVETCDEPTEVEAGEILHNQVLINWVANDTETNWDVSYGIDPLDNPESGTVLNISSKPYTLTGLEEETTYQVYVRANCSEDSQSAWSGPVSFETIATPSTEADILTYSFENQVSSEILAEDYIINIVMPEGTEYPLEIAADFTVSDNATVTVADLNQESTVTLNTWNNNTEAIVYRVLAEDGVTFINWSVFVDIAS